MSDQPQRQFRIYIHPAFTTYSGKTHVDIAVRTANSVNNTNHQPLDFYEANMLVECYRISGRGYRI